MLSHRLEYGLPHQKDNAAAGSAQPSTKAARAPRSNALTRSKADVFEISFESRVAFQLDDIPLLPSTPFRVMCFWRFKILAW